MNYSKKIKIILFINIFLVIGILIYSPMAQAQNWVEMPPYNTLWPLWSPALSPIDAVTGLPTPIVTSLAPDTVLPAMPGLTWDPSLPYPWLLYGTTSGLAFYDPLYGINLWPAPSLRDDAGLPAPITLPTDYINLPPIEASWLASNLPIANNLAYLGLSKIFPAPMTIFDLLSPLDILGPTLGVPSALAPWEPPPLPPPPTIPTQSFSALVIPTALIPGLTIPLPPAPVPTIATVSGALLPLPQSPLVYAEQVGAWTGNWYSLIKTTQLGPMNLDLAENSTGILTGTVSLLGHKYITIPANVTGTILPGATYFELEGSIICPITGNVYVLELRCTLINETIIEGTYYVYSLDVTKTDYGEFVLDLIAPAITITPPVVLPVVPTLTPVVPTIAVTIPVPTIGITAPVPTIAAPIPVTTPVPTIVAPIPVTTTVPIPTAPLLTGVVAPPTAAVSGFVPLPLFRW